MTTRINTPEGEVTIRTASEHDATQIYELRLEALQSHPESFTADVKMTIENGVAAWVKLIEGYGKDQSGAIVIASCDDRLIGWQAWCVVIGQKHDTEQIYGECTSGQHGVDSTFAKPSSATAWIGQGLTKSAW